MINKAVNVPNQNPFADTPHNPLVFLLLYFDLPPQDEDLSVSYQNNIDVIPYRAFGLQIKKILLDCQFYTKSASEIVSTPWTDVIAQLMVRKEEIERMNASPITTVLKDATL
jgi:hypothetical protein